MKSTMLQTLVTTTFLLAATLASHAQSTAFTYQGRLQDGGAPAVGLHDFEFRLFNAASGGTQQGPTVTLDDLGVSNGLFTATLDFGANFPGADRFLQIAVRPGASTGAYVNLSPRQPITSAPYAVTASGISGTLPAGQLPANVALTDRAQTFSANQTFQTPTTFNDRVGIGTNVPQQALHVAGSYARVDGSGNEQATLGGDGAGSDVELGSSNPGIGAVALFNKGNGDYMHLFAKGATFYGPISGDGSGLTALPAGQLTGTLPDTRLSANVALLNASQTFSAPNNFNASVTLNPPARLSFGSQTRQMLNLWDTSSGIGVQTSTLYFRTSGNGLLNPAGNFSWFAGGQHSDTTFDPGLPLGLFESPREMMRLDGNGQLTVFGQGANGVRGNSSGAGASGVYGENSGGGNGVSGRTTGSGSAVFGDNTNPNGWAGNFNGNVSVNGNQFFGNQTRQMINLYNADYGIGVQSATTYFRTGGEFMWYRGGSHSDTFGDPGTGGNSLMRLGSSGDLLLVGRLGIGTTTPGTELDVVATQGLGRFTSTNASNGSVLIFNNRSPLASYLGAINFETNGSTVGQIAYLASDRFAFRAGGVERMSLGGGILTVEGIGNEKAFISGAGNEIVIGSAKASVNNIRFGNLTEFPNRPMDCYARSFNPSSDRHAKQDFRSVEAAAILEKVVALPISEWAYKGESATRHIGPVAQDFKEAFGLGSSDKSIATVDADGVALAAIQGLNQKLEETRAENAVLRRELSEIKQLLTKLTTKGN